MRYIKFAGGVIAGIIAIDMFGFMAWALLGQIPTDNFYIGTITAHFLRLFM